MGQEWEKEAEGMRPTGIKSLLLRCVRELGVGAFEEVVKRGRALCDLMRTGGCGLMGPEELRHRTSLRPLSVANRSGVRL